MICEDNSNHIDITTFGVADTTYSTASFGQQYDDFQNTLTFGTDQQQGVTGLNFNFGLPTNSMVSQTGCRPRHLQEARKLSLERNNGHRQHTTHYRKVRIRLAQDKVTTKNQAEKSRQKYQRTPTISREEVHRNKC